MAEYSVRRLTHALESVRRRGLRTLAVKAAAETPAIDATLDALATDAAALRAMLGWATARDGGDENSQTTSTPDGAFVALAVGMLRRCAAREGGAYALRAVGARAVVASAIEDGAGNGERDGALRALLSAIASGASSEEAPEGSASEASFVPLDFTRAPAAAFDAPPPPSCERAPDAAPAWEAECAVSAPTSEIDETVSAAEGWRFGVVHLCPRDQQQLFELQMAMRMSVENLALRAGGVAEWVAAQKSAVRSCAEVTALLDAGVPAQALLQGAVGLGSSRPSAGLAVVHGLLSLVRCPLVSLRTSHAHPDQVPVPLAALRALANLIAHLARSVAESFDPELGAELVEADGAGCSGADALVRTVEMQHRLPICHAAATFFCAIAPLLKRHMSASANSAVGADDAYSLPFFALALETSRKLLGMLHEPVELERGRHLALNRLRYGAAMDALASVALYHNERCVALLRSEPETTSAGSAGGDGVVAPNAITVGLIQLFVDALLSASADSVAAGARAPQRPSAAARGREHSALSQIALAAAFSPVAAATRPALHGAALQWLECHDAEAWSALEAARAGGASAVAAAVAETDAETDAAAGPYATLAAPQLAQRFVAGLSQLHRGVGTPPAALAPFATMARAALDHLGACSTSRAFVDALRALRSMCVALPSLGRALADGALPVCDLHPCFARFYETRPVGEGDHLALYEVLMLCEAVILPHVFARAAARSATAAVAARTLKACAALLTQHASIALGTSVRRPAVVALDMRAAILRTARQCAKYALDAVRAAKGGGEESSAHGELWAHGEAVLFNPGLLNVSGSDVLSLDVCFALLQLGDLVAPSAAVAEGSAATDAAAVNTDPAALIRRLVAVASAMDYSDGGDAVSVRAQLETSTRRVRVAVGCLCIVSARATYRAASSAWLVSGTTAWCERLAKADDAVVRANAMRLLSVFASADAAHAFLDCDIVDARVSTWVADGVALARDAERCWLVRQAALELAVCALARLARGARTQRAERAFALAWRAVESDVRTLLLTAPSATGAKRPATMQSAVASASCDVLCAAAEAECLDELRAAQHGLHVLVGDVLDEQRRVQRRAEQSTAHSAALRSVVRSYCGRQRDAALLACGRLFLGQRLLWAQALRKQGAAAPEGSASDWVAAALSAIVFIANTRTFARGADEETAGGAAPHTAGLPWGSTGDVNGRAEAFAEDQAVGLIAAALARPTAAAAAATAAGGAQRAAVGEAPKLRDDAAAVSRAFGALAATALDRLRSSCNAAHAAIGGRASASASDGCAVAVNRVRLTMRMVAATCNSTSWARVIGMDGSCAATTGGVVRALAGLFSAEGEHFASCAPSVTCALRAALECSAAAAVAAVDTPLPAALAKRIQRATKTILGHRSSADERDASRTILIRCLSVLQSFLSHAGGEACSELPMRALAEALTGVWPLADRDTGVMFALLSAMANCALGSPHFGREFLLHCRWAGSTARVIQISFNREAAWSLRLRGMRCLQALSVVSESRLLLIKDGLVERCVSAARDALYSGRKKVIPHMMTLLAALTFAPDGCRAAGLEQDVLFCELFPALLGGANRRLQRPFRASDALVSAVALLLRNLAFSRVHLPLFVEKQLSMDVHARGGALACTESIGVGALILMCCLSRCSAAARPTATTVEIATRVVDALRALCHANQKAVAVLRRSEALVRCLQSAADVLALCDGDAASGTAKGVAKLQHLFGHAEI